MQDMPGVQGQGQQCRGVELPWVEPAALLGSSRLDGHLGVVLSFLQEAVFDFNQYVQQSVTVSKFKGSELVRQASLLLI